MRESKVVGHHAGAQEVIGVTDDEGGFEGVGFHQLLGLAKVFPREAGGPLDENGADRNASFDGFTPTDFGFAEGVARAETAGEDEFSLRGHLWLQHGRGL